MFNKKIIIKYNFVFCNQEISDRCQQDKVDQNSSLPKIQIKNGIIFYMDIRK